MTLSNLLSKLVIRINNFKNNNTVSGTLGTNTTVLKSSSIDTETIIGDECFINTNTIITKTTIGNYCSIGANVVIGPGEHDLDKISTSGRFYQDAYHDLTKKSCIIKNDVWIGTHSIILRGVCVGNGAVIGANSVVTKDVPDFAVVAGVPAKILKFRFDPETQEKISLSEWWNRDLNEAKKIIGQLEAKCDIK